MRASSVRTTLGAKEVTFDAFGEDIADGAEVAASTPVTRVVMARADTGGLALTASRGAVIFEGATGDLAETA